jgi:excisionase family DNA binding protein
MQQLLLEDRVFSVKDAAERLSISRRHLWRLAQDEKIKLISLSARRRGIRASELLRFMEAG